MIILITAQMPRGLDTDEIGQHFTSGIHHWGSPLDEEEDRIFIPIRRLTGNDRFFARNAQMSIVGLILPNVDTPIPDIIVNPHAINSRPLVSDMPDELPQLEDDSIYDDIPDLVDYNIRSSSTHVNGDMFAPRSAQRGTLNGLILSDDLPNLEDMISGG